MIWKSERFRGCNPRFSCFITRLICPYNIVLDILQYEAKFHLWRLLQHSSDYIWDINYTNRYTYSDTITTRILLEAPSYELYNSECTFYSIHYTMEPIEQIWILFDDIIIPVTRCTFVEHSHGTRLAAYSAMHGYISHILQPTVISYPSTIHPVKIACSLFSFHWDVEHISVNHVFYPAIRFELWTIESVRLGFQIPSSSISSNNSL